MKKIVLLFAFIVTGTILLHAQSKFELMRQQGISISNMDTRVLEDQMYERYSMSDDRYRQVGISNASVVAKYNDSLYVLLYNKNCKYFGYLNENSDGTPKLERNKWGVEKVSPYGYRTKVTKSQNFGAPVYEYYIGEWKNNLRHGKGYYVDSDGKMFSGTWKNGYLKSKTKKIELTKEEKEHVLALVGKINEIKVDSFAL